MRVCSQRQEQHPLPGPLSPILPRALVPTTLPIFSSNPRVEPTLFANLSPQPTVNRVSDESTSNQTSGKPKENTASTDAVSAVEIFLPPPQKIDLAC
ncbi:hypothetical protein RRG08_049476 [Elysia crispata]|uniref:Uncharacterized protein n=1 Tax=Elysia crispata TaxID=231223 RepID=A0AAE1DLT3_9GAST|nr:hypothetical protein RRG08_049476 [Elysia crispata]